MPTITRQYLIPKDKTSEYIILIVAIFLIILTWTLILYFTQGKSSTTVKAYETCPSGECPTNIRTGEKRCPVNLSAPIQYDPINEVCNPPDTCTANQTPYALQLDGSSNVNGLCGTGNKNCRCVNYFSTPSYIEVLFNSTGGLLGGLNQNQNRISLVQTANQYIGEGNNIPIIYNDPTSQFFEISPSLLSYLTPSPCAYLYEDNPVLEDWGNLSCINLNPCVVGRMAYIPGNVQELNNFANRGDFSSGISVGCVPNSVLNSPADDNSCIANDLINPNKNLYEYAPVFDTTIGKIRCIPVNIPGPT